MTCAAPPAVFRMYRKADGEMHYRSAWVDAAAKTVFAIAGRCGDQGMMEQRKVDTGPEGCAVVRDLAREARLGGYRPLAPSRHAVLEVVWPAAGAPDRHAVEDLLDREMARRGLGYCDGGELRGARLAVRCHVVAFPAARGAVRRALETAGMGGFEIVRAGRPL